MEDAKRIEEKIEVKKRCNKCSVKRPIDCFKETKKGEEIELVLCKKCRDYLNQRRKKMREEEKKKKEKIELIDISSMIPIGENIL
jgi:hypothetical protein